MNTQYHQLITQLGHPESGFDSIHDLLWDFYLLGKPIHRDEISTLMRHLEDKFSTLSFPQADEVFTLIYRLCCEYEHLAFQEGVRIGAAVVLELSQF